MQETQQTPHWIGWIALAALIVAAPVGAEPALGSYSCAANLTVGLQDVAARGQRYAGRVELPAGEKRFGITLARTEVGQGKRCRPRQPGTQDPLVSDEYSLWWFCRAKTELTFSPGKYEPALRGDDLNIFRDRLSGWLHLADDLRYVFAYTDFRRQFLPRGGKLRAGLAPGRCAQRSTV